MNMIRLIWLVMIAAGLIITGCAPEDRETTIEERAGETTEETQGMFDDTTISTEVKSKLASDVEMATLTDIEVNTTNGIVTLAGEVESEAVKQQAEQVARTVEGVRSVNNNLVVNPEGEGQQPQSQGARKGSATN